MKRKKKNLLWAFLILSLSNIYPAYADESPVFMTPDKIDVAPVIMMKNGMLVGCGYSFDLLFLKNGNEIQVVAGSFNFSQLDTSAFSAAGTFKLVVKEAKVDASGLEENSIKEKKLHSAWAKTSDPSYEITSSYLTKVDVDAPHYFGGTSDLVKGSKIIDTWVSLTADGGEIGYNTTGHGYDVVINIPKGLIVGQVEQSVYTKVAECMRNFTTELKTRAEAEIKSETK